MSDDLHVGQEPGTEESMWRMPKATVVNFGFLFGIAGSLASIVSVAVTVRSGPVSGLLLVFIVIFPMMTLLAVIFYVVWIFGRELRATIANFQTFLDREVTRYSAKEQALTDKLAAIETEASGLQTMNTLQQELLKRGREIVVDVAKGIRPTQTDVQLTRALHDACRELAERYSQATGHEVRGSVKMLLPSENDKSLLVRTVAREGGLRSDDKTRRHALEDNSDFMALMRSADMYWHCSDIMELPPGSYSNTSPRYDYRSVVVWPIVDDAVVVDYVAEDDALGGDTTIVGFLCIDCREPAVLTTTHAVAGFPFVDAVSHMITRHYTHNGLA